MANVKIQRISEPSDPALREFAEGVANAIIAAGCKAAANQSNPKAYPIPAGDSLERSFLDYLRARPIDRQKLVIDKCLPLVRDKQLPGFRGVDIAGARPALEATLAKASIKSLAKSNLAKRVAPEIADGNPGFRLQNSPDSLQFYLMGVKCIDETDGFLGSEAGSDEIALGGLVIDAAGNTKQIARIDMGDFSSDGVTKYTNRLLGAVDFRSGQGWPKKFQLVLTLAELDNGGFPSFLNKLLDEVRKEVTKILVGLGNSLAPVIGEAIGSAIAWVLDKVFGWIKDIWEDDVFKPCAVEFDFSSAEDRFNGASETGPIWIEWKGHGGRYRAWFKARLALAAEAAIANGAIVYEHAHFQGKSASLGIGRHDLAAIRARGVENDTISSLKVGPGLRVIAYGDAGFSGVARVFTGQVSFVGNDFNDRISSLVVEPVGVTLFQHANFNGLSQSFGPGRYDVGKLTIGNDVASSVLVPPGFQVTLYEHAGFKGKKKVLRADTSYVGDDFNDIVSSLVVDLI